MTFIEELKSCSTVNENGDDAYEYNQIKAKFKHRLFNDHLFVFRVDGTWMDFAFIECHGRDESGDNEGQLFWYGQGTLGDLKELRHSYFPEYVFYANPEFIKQCCDILLEYFNPY